MLKLIASLIFLLACCASAQAQDQPFRYESFSVSYELRDDATYLARYSWQAKALTQPGLERVRQAYISHSASVEESKVVAAYTKKADGRQIDVPPGNFQLETNTGVSGKPAFSDSVRTTIIYPDLAVGDSVFLEYTIDLKEAIYPGIFSVAEYFSRQQEYDKVTFQVVSPASMWAQFDSKDMKQTVTEADGKRTVSWTYSNPKAVQSDRRNYSVFDPASVPNLSFSTFKTYGDIAEAYGSRARPKAAPTERVRKLADEIVQGKSGEREKTQALYEWVARNIAYAGNCIGIGAVVPRDQDFVLDNKMGDCKDHATLLQALLAAQGIASTQVLVNAGTMYKLPAIPVGSNVNHVFNYVPSLAMYMDSTSDSTPFGMLSVSVQGKPVLAVDGFKMGQITPGMKPGSNSQTMKTRIEFQADGSASGSVEVRLQGLFAAGTRAKFRDWPAKDQKKFVRETLRAYKISGDGAIAFDDPDPLKPEFTYTIQFTAKDFLAPGGGVLPFAPIFWTPASVSAFLGQSLDADADVDVGCTNGKSVEEYTYVLSKTMRIVSLPKAVALKSPLVAYAEAYRQAGNVLTVSKSFDDQTPGPVCPPEVSRAYAKAVGQAQQAARTQVLFK